MIRSPWIPALLIGMLAVPTARAQQAEIVEQRTLNGTVVMFGNTLGRSGWTDDIWASASTAGVADRPGPRHSAYTWINDRQPPTTDQNPGANWGNYTTGDWRSNFSYADLDLSVVGGGRPVQAWLVWSGSCRQNNPISGPAEDVSAFINDSVILEYPSNIGPQQRFIAPDDVFNHCGQASDGYVAWADVSELVPAWREGWFGVGRVPGTQNFTLVGFAGWTIVAIVEDPTVFTEPHQVTIYRGWVPPETLETAPATKITDFCYPAPTSGMPKPGRLLATAVEGDAILFGDYLLFGNSTAWQGKNVMWGRRNELDNFFGSQIVDRSGALYDGDRYHTLPDHMPWRGYDCAVIDTWTNDYGLGDPLWDGIDPACLVDGARQGWDIADVPLNDDFGTDCWGGPCNPNILDPGDTEAWFLPMTEGDDYRMVALALDLPTVSASIATVVQPVYSPSVYVHPGAGITGTAHFDILLTNVGTAPADNVVYRHPFPGNVTDLVSFQYRYNGGPLTTPSPAPTLAALDGAGIDLPDLAPGEFVRVVFDVEVSDYIPRDPILTRAEWSYDWTSCNNTQRESVFSDPLEVDVTYCIDVDRDGLCKDLEDTLGTDDTDMDSDDDGLADGEEVNITLTNPANADTDGDGIQDGTELGLIPSDRTPDTDVNVFIPDADPTTTTNPKNPDTDGGGTRDGVEDGNRDGEIDLNECDPNDPADDGICVDSDGDGLNDAYEDDNGLDKYDDDTDNDGLMDGYEVTNGTNPANPDTDGDGIQDGTESGLTTPQGDDTNMGVFQPDADGSTTTSPVLPDSDGDGLGDGVEDVDRDGAVDANETDPDDDDTDDDGVGDGTEDAGCTDPLDPDTDGDGLLDGTELGYTVPEGFDTDLSVFVADSDPTTTTDPCNDDTDGGGLGDGDEDLDGDGEYEPGETDPNDPTDDFPTTEEPDCDGDGWSDETELELGTDPCNEDTDGDGLNDPIDGREDHDGDGLIDALDTDSDDDGLLDGDEDLNGDGVLDPDETDPDVPNRLQGAGGCDCSQGSSAPAPLWGLLLGLVPLLRRRSR